MKEKVYCCNCGMSIGCDAVMVIDCSRDVNGIKPACVEVPNIGLNSVNLHGTMAGSSVKITDSHTEVIDSPVPLVNSRIKASSSHSSKPGYQSGTPISDLPEVDSLNDVTARVMKALDLTGKVIDSDAQVNCVMTAELVPDTKISDVKEHSTERVEVWLSDRARQKIITKSEEAEIVDVDAITSLLSQTTVADPVTSEQDQQLELRKRAPIGSYPTQQYSIPQTPSYRWNDIQVVNTPPQVHCQFQRRTIEDDNPQPQKYMKTSCPCMPETQVTLAVTSNSISRQPAIDTLPSQIGLRETNHISDSFLAIQGLSESDVHKEYRRLKYILDGSLPTENIAVTPGFENSCDSYHDNHTVNTVQQQPDAILQSTIPVQDNYDIEAFFNDFFNSIADEFGAVQTPEACTIQTRKTSKNDEEQETRALSWASKLSRNELESDDNEGDSLLHTVIILQDSYLLKALLARLERECLLKWLINKQNREKQTPLYLAVASKLDEVTPEVHENIIKRLLECGAEVSGWSCHSSKNHSKEVIYQTPLHLAASLGQEKILDMLLKSNADGINQANSILETPVHCAIKKHGCLEKNKQRRDCCGVLRILKHYNANFTAKTKMNKTILHMAADKGDHVLMAFLLDLLTQDELCTIINEQDDNGNTVLHIASGLEVQPTVERVMAAEYMIRLLLAKSADVGIKNRENKRAYDFVLRSCLSEEVRFLLMRSQKSTKQAKKVQRMTEL